MLTVLFVLLGGSHLAVVYERTLETTIQSNESSQLVWPVWCVGYDVITNTVIASCLSFQ